MIAQRYERIKNLRGRREEFLAKTEALGPAAGQHLDKRALLCNNEMNNLPLKGADADACDRR